MAFRGRKVADIYAELHLDRDTARAALAGMGAALGPDADKAGRDLGKRMSDGLAKAVEASSARLVKARREESKATDAVKLAELRLNEAREKGVKQGSTLLALEQRLAQANQRLADSHDAVAVATRKHGDAERRLADDIAGVGKASGPNADRAGKDIGNKLSQGIHLSIVRNSPLIAAAAGAALALGGPAVLTAATGLFAGIGIIAAAQSAKVGHAWSTTWGGISSSAVKSASVIEPVLVKVADNVGDAYQRMAPRIEDAFAASAPQIEVFTNGILDLAENALPGLVRAVENGMPVTVGFADFLGKTGTGISDFFDRITEHAPAAGQVWSQLGDTMGTLLPLLGELIGQGAELAADVLPVVNSGLGLLLTITTALGPALPVVATGLAALKIGSSVANGIGTLATKLDLVAAKGGAVSGIAGKVAGGLSGIAGSAGAAAAGVAFVVVAAQKWVELGEKSEDVALRLGQAMHVGGSQAQAAGKLFDQGEQISGWIPDAIEDISLFGYSVGDLIPTAESSKAAFDKWMASLGASGAAAAEVQLRTQDLDVQMRKYGEGSPQVEAAARALTDAQAEAASVAADLQMATEGVTDAMLAQADAALALADADLAHRQALDQADDSYAALNEAIRDHGAASEEASDAAMAWEADLSRVVATAGKLASDALPATMDANSKLALSQIAQRDALRELASQYGDKLPPALQTALAQLEATTAGYDLAKLEADRLAAATGTASEKMQKLGETEATPKIKGDASVFDGAHAKTMEKLREIDAQTPTPKAKMDSSMFAGEHATAMSKIGQLAGQTPTPSAWLNSGPFAGTYNTVMGWIGYVAGQRPTPAVLLADYASGGLEKILGKLAAIQSKTVTVTTIEKSAKGKAGGGRVDDSPIFAAVGRKVQGPGGPTDDLVRAIGPGGADYRLSPGEWILNEMVSRREGDGKVQALNAGRATIVPIADRLSPRGLGTAAASSLLPAPMAGAVSGGGKSVVVQRLDVHLQGFDIRDRAEVRRFARELRQALIDLDREQG